ncbi:MAG: carbohydrate ABC transporter permease [Alphaproteobacteria bacterium]|nr:carbohydrate ABC transporter permease [Alphaproteobacteria bacterium]
MAEQQIIDRGARYRLKKQINQVLFWVLMTFIVLYSVFPFYWAIVSSLKESADLFTVEFWPDNVTLQNYVNVFKEQPFGQNIVNSVMVSLSTVILCLFLSVTAAYALGRVSFKGRGMLLLVILSVSMFPQVAVLSGMFELIQMLGIYNTRTGLVLAYMLFTLPFTVWILTTFMRELPKELEEAAIVDGASPWVIITKVFLPLLGPVFATTGLLAFIAAWNEFLFALTFTLTNDMRTVPVAISLMSGNSQHELPWGSLMAASVIVTVPLIILVLIFQKRIVSGLTAGAVKG